MAILTDDEGNKYVAEFASYVVNFANLAPNGTAEGQIQIQADSAFRWISSAMYAVVASAAFTRNTQPVPNVTLQITDNGSGRVLFQPGPVPIPTVFGFGDLPFILPVPRQFKERSSVSFSVVNFDAAVTFSRLSLVLQGAKLFKL